MAHYGEEKEKGGEGRLGGRSFINSKCIKVVVLQWLLQPDSID